MAEEGKYISLAWNQQVSGSMVPVIRIWSTHGFLVRIGFDNHPQ